MFIGCSGRDLDHRIIRSQRAVSIHFFLPRCHRTLGQWTSRSLAALGLKLRLQCVNCGLLNWVNCRCRNKKASSCSLLVEIHASRCRNVNSSRHERTPSTSCIPTTNLTSKKQRRRRWRHAWGYISNWQGCTAAAAAAVAHDGEDYHASGIATKMTGQYVTMTDGDSWQRTTSVFQLPRTWCGPRRRNDCSGFSAFGETTAIISQLRHHF